MDLLDEHQYFRNPNNRKKINENINLILSKKQEKAERK